MDASCVNIGNISTTDISLIYIKNIPTRNVSGRTQSITTVYNGHMYINVRECVLDITICKQTKVVQIRHEPSYKQLEVKTNRTSFL
jgi:hypothetical protein